MHEIKIYGEISPTNEKEEQSGICTLAYLQEQLKEAGGKPIKVRINSFGGDVNAGFAMYAELRRYAKQHKVSITTFGEAYVASIATVIFLAGDVRILTAQTHPFVHNAWYETAGDAKKMAEAAKELDRASDLIAKHYASHTKLTYKIARELMDRETYITVQEALAMNFATDVEKLERPKALMQFSKNRNFKQKNDITEMKKGNSLMKALQLLITKHGVQNKQITTANEEVLDFPDLEDDETPETGDKANIDGKPAEGDYIMKSGETYTFVAGELTAILEPQPYEDPEAVMETETYKALLSKFNTLEETAATALSVAEGMQAKLDSLAKAKGTTPTQKPARQTPSAKSGQPAKTDISAKLEDIKKRALDLKAAQK